MTTVPMVFFDAVAVMAGAVTVAVMAGVATVAVMAAAADLNVAADTATGHRRLGCAGRGESSQDDDTVTN